MERRGTRKKVKFSVTTSKVVKKIVPMRRSVAYVCSRLVRETFGALPFWKFSKFRRRQDSPALAKISFWQKLTFVCWCTKKKGRKRVYRTGLTFVCWKIYARPDKSHGSSMFANTNVRYRCDSLSGDTLVLESLYSFREACCRSFRIDCEIEKWKSKETAKNSGDD